MMGSMTTPLSAPIQRLQTFRQNLLGTSPLRRDALFELIDTHLTVVQVCAALGAGSPFPASVGLEPHIPAPLGHGA